MAPPKCVTEALAALREARAPLAARLDAIDLAIDNVARVWGVNGAAASPAAVKARRRAGTKRQGAPVKRATKARAVKVAGGAAAERRSTLLALIEKADVGLTHADLCTRTPKMDGVGRRNALNTLRVAGQIRRAGNTWVKAGA
jgi:hypothetical protein